MHRCLSCFLNALTACIMIRNYRKETIVIQFVYVNSFAACASSIIQPPISREPFLFSDRRPVTTNVSAVGGRSACCSIMATLNPLHLGLGLVELRSRGSTEWQLHGLGSRGFHLPFSLTTTCTVHALPSPTRPVSRRWTSTVAPAAHRACFRRWPLFQGRRIIINRAPILRYPVCWLEEAADRLA
ncbi:hypothetical protein F5148DRAFT_541381 [Russula earlei]|uniref:Uncharacterized protein n=1 Tax=Russula earlei TaxID=71964 RepID=A0ACC0UG14_9AGAM|nr:hypothetical protein F5148DRAFT_541381 [Russula earlei]